MRLTWPQRPCHFKAASPDTNHRTVGTAIVAVPATGLYVVTGILQIHDPMIVHGAKRFRSPRRRLLTAETRRIGGCLPL